MVTKIQAHDYGDLLAMIPSMLGFTPQESVVIIPFDDNISAGAMRMDIPPQDFAGDWAREAGNVMARIPDASGAVIAIYSAQVHEAVEYAAEFASFALLHTEMELLDRLYVCGDGYGRFGDEDAPRPVSELVPPEAAGNVSVEQSQDAGATIPESDPALLVAMLSIDPVPLDDESFNATIEESLDWDAGHLSPNQASWLVGVLNSPLYRDVYLSQIVTDEDYGVRMLAIQRAYLDDNTQPAEADALFGNVAKPNPYRIERALEFARVAASVLPLPGALSAAAWLSWALGRSSHAAIYADKALAMDAQYGFAKVVRSFVEYGHLPAFAFEGKGH